MGETGKERKVFLHRRDWYGNALYPSKMDTMSKSRV